jgi:hypothetical protein
MCASACALTWFGGVERGGEVGLHRPRITDPEFKSLAPAQATAVYRRTLNEIEAYLHEMEAPQPIIDAMVATGSSEIRWVDAQNDHLERPPRFAEWEDANCGSFTKDEENTVNKLYARGYSAPTFNEALLTHDERLLLHFLKDKRFEITACQAQFRSRQVNQLPPP